MTPNPWLFAALITTAVSAAVWVYVVEPRLDARQHPGDQLADEIEQFLRETTRP